MKTARCPRNLLLRGLVCSNVLLFGLSGLSIHQSRQSYEQQAEVSTQNVALALDKTLASNIAHVDLALRALADELERQLANGALDVERMGALLAKYEQRLTEVDAIWVSDAEGKVIVGRGLGKTQAPSLWDRDGFLYHRDHADRQLTISKPLTDRVPNHHFIGLAHRYNHPDGRFAGVIFAPIALNYFSAVLSSLGLGTYGVLTLRDKDLGLIVREPALPDQSTGRIGSTIDSAVLRDLLSGDARWGTVRTSIDSEGIDRIVTFRRVRSSPFIATVGIATEDCLQPWYHEVLEVSAISMSFLVMSLFLGGWLLRLCRQVEQQQLALADQDGKLESLIETIPDYIQFKNGDGRWIVANQRCLRLFGLENQAWRGLTDRELGLKKPSMAEALNACQRGDEAAWRVGQPYRSEERLIHANGVTEFDVIKVPLFDSLSRRRAMVVVGRDVTERNLAIQAVQRESEKNLAVLLNASDGLHILDLNGDLVEASDSFYRMLGYQRHEIRKLNVADWDERGCKAQLAEIIRSAYSGKARVEFEVRHRRKDGTVFDAEVSGFPLTVHGEPMMLFSSRDITDRKTLLQCVQAHSKLAEAVINSMIDGVAVCVETAEFPYLRCTVWNEAMSSLTGYSQKEINLVGWYQSVCPNHAIQERVRQRIERIRYGDHMMAEAWVITRKDGARRTVELSTRDVIQQDGAIHILVIMRDVTEHDRTTLKLE